MADDPMQTCHLNSIANNGSGSLTAQKRMKKSELTGFSFVSCHVTGNGPIYLGRAWGPFSRVVFLLTQIDAPIYPVGWFDWGIAAREKYVTDVHHSRLQTAITQWTLEFWKICKIVTHVEAFK